VREVEAIVALLTDRIDEPVARAPAFRIVANVRWASTTWTWRRAPHVRHRHEYARRADRSDRHLAFGLCTRRASDRGGDRLFVRRLHGWTPTCMLGAELHGATLGIVGMGRIVVRWPAGGRLRDAVL